MSQFAGQASHPPKDAGDATLDRTPLRLPTWRPPSRKFLCAACRALVCWSNAAVRVNGRHEHTFFNPGGFVYHIACFREAPGATPVSALHHDFSWFPDHGWRISVCKTCGVHLGWRFETSDSGFFGLIRNRLAAVDVAEGGPGDLG